MSRRPTPSPAGSPAEHAVAIDLGITNAQIAVCSNGVPSLVRDQSGQPSVPMVVACVEGKILLGQAARRQQFINSASVFGITRLLGRRHQSAAVTAMQRRLPFRLEADGSGCVAVSLGERTCSIDEICGIVLRRLRSIAQEYLSDEIRDVTIAVPAYFDEAQRLATVGAAKLAGLEPRIVEAPTAALRRFFPDLPAGTRQAVVHLGGASCEVTVLDVGNVSTDKRAQGGDAFLGGDSLDAAIIEHLLTETEAARYPAMRSDPICRQRLVEAAERAKWEAGSGEEALIDLPHLHPEGEQELHVQLVLSRARLEELAQPMLARVLELCRETLERARVSPRSLDGFTLVGGQARSPFVREALAGFFGREPRVDADPEGTVARGAAIDAHLHANPPDLELAL